ncbi:unnamed protein product [Paramecium sonneborni]|uniref:Uncharacterized protein n=1 Tax=Paramecium sonneborni TaxID=65129 RepID=A0A8S1Q4Z4_9CILI|nr:unnamed protein product [Paramecium sonneborni]
MDVINLTKISNYYNENERQISSRLNYNQPKSSRTLNATPPCVEAVRSKPLIKIERKVRSPMAQKLNDLDFGYLQELDRKKMFMMIRLGHIKDPSKLNPVHNYNKIPVLPSKKKRINLTPSPRRIESKTVQITDIPLPMFSMKIVDDPYQIQEQCKQNTQKLFKKQKRLNIINKRILNKYSNY